MADKSFEQRVQHELGSLKMRPDPAVWANVEAHLHKEKKRRWLIWFFLLAAVAGASCWFYFTSDGGNEPHTTAQQLPINKQNILPKDASTKETIINKENKEQQNPSNENNKITTDIKAGVNEPVTVTTNPVTNIPVENEKKKQAPVSAAITKKIKENNADKKDIVKNEIASNANNTKGIITTDQHNATETQEAINHNNKSALENSATILQKKSADSGKEEIVNIPVENIKSSSDTVAGNKSADNNLPGRKDQKKWQWSVSADLGSSGLVSPIFSLVKLDALSNAPQPPGNTTVIPLKEPVVRSAASYAVQAHLTKQLDHTFGFGFEAGYSLLQTKTNVGQRIDSTSYFTYASATNTNGFYYGNGNLSSYTNRYHFLQFGIHLYTSFAMFKIIKARWQLGAGLHLLAGSNGLHYDPSNGKSFINNDLFLKKQPYITTGIDFAIGKDPFLFLGPHVQYHTRRLSSLSGEKEHLSMYAAKLTWMLRKKKK